MRKRYLQRFEVWMDEYWPSWRVPKNQHNIRYWDLRAAFDAGSRAADPEQEEYELKQCDVRQATHVRIGDRVERIAHKWGIDDKGRLAKPTEGGFGVVTVKGERVDMWSARSYWKEQ